MKIAMFSDTHLVHKDDHRVLRIPEVDLALHAGDATMRGTVEEVRCFLDWFSELPAKQKIFIAGNHDWLFQKEPALARSLVRDYRDKNVIYLEDELTSAEGLQIYGSPWQPEFCNWAFNLPRGEALRRKWAMIPDTTDILITHGPPWLILDEAGPGVHVGCEDLAKRIIQSMHPPKVHLFGHIHFSSGIQHHEGVLYVNAAICDDAYRVARSPVILNYGFDPKAPPGFRENEPGILWSH